jgi:membrane-associated phospholipid phosphatase
MRSFLFFTCFFFSFNSHAQNFDINLLDKINSPPSQPGDKNWSFISNSVAPVSIAAPLSMFITGLARNDADLKLKSYQTGASILVSTLFTTGLKSITKRERPFEKYPGTIYQKMSVSSYSFPSGHTSSAFALATSLSLSFPKWYVIVPSYTYAAAVGYSRMYLGVHYPTDVLAGMISGIGISLLSFEVGNWINKNNTQ